MHNINPLPSLLTTLTLFFDEPLFLDDQDGGWVNVSSGTGSPG